VLPTREPFVLTLVTTRSARILPNFTSC
jgi:hypothetical protein